MKKYAVEINGKIRKITKEALAASYCGAYCCRWVNKLGRKLDGDFRWHYKLNIRWIRKLVDEMPKHISSQKLMESI